MIEKYAGGGRCALCSFCNERSDLLFQLRIDHGDVIMLLHIQSPIPSVRRNPHVAQCQCPLSASLAFIFHSFFPTDRTDLTRSEPVHPMANAKTELLAPGQIVMIVIILTQIVVH